MDTNIKVLICGAAGRMGRQTVASVLLQQDLTLVGCFDLNNVGKDAGKLAGVEPCGVRISDDLELILTLASPDVMVDFSGGAAAPGNVLTCLSYKVACVVGSTGISEEDVEKIRKKSEETGVPVLIVPNFSIGAVLMMQFAKLAAKHYEWAEIIELHHEKKADAPSGTAIRTAALMKEEREKFKNPVNEEEKIKGVRGGSIDGIKIHSVRLPGLLAHQQVMLGGSGETLTIKHDSLTRECFMPGVMLAIRKVKMLSGMNVGLEAVM